MTVKGKAETNGKPFERQKRTDDEWLTNSPWSVRTVCLNDRTGLFERFGQPFERMSKNFERTGKPFERVNKSFERTGKPFEQVNKSFERSRRPTVGRRFS